MRHAMTVVLGVITSPILLVTPITAATQSTAQTCVMQAITGETVTPTSFNFSSLVNAGLPFVCNTGGATIVPGSLERDEVELTQGRMDSGAIVPPIRIDALQRQAMVSLAGSDLNVVQAFEGHTQKYGVIPTEPTIAAGPEHIVSGGNLSIVVFDRANPGATRTEIDAAAFFGTDPLNESITDVRCYYDAVRGHFYAICVGTDFSQTSLVHLAVSQTANPRAGWWRYTFNWRLLGMEDAGHFGDYPMLGMSSDKLAIICPTYGAASQCALTSYAGDKIVVLDPATVCNGQPVTRRDLWGFPAPPGGDQYSVRSTAIGVNLTPDPLLHLVTVRMYGGSSIAYRQILGPPTSPCISAGDTVHVAMYSVPSSALNAGCAPIRPFPVSGAPFIVTPGFYVRNGVATLAWHYRASDGSSTVNVIRVTRVRTYDSAVLMDETFAETGKAQYVPAALEDSAGTLLLGFDRSSAVDFAGCAATMKRRGDSALRPSTVLKAGTDCVLPSGQDAQARWGDFTGIAPDPFVSTDRLSVVWYVGQWAKSAHAKNGTWISEISVSYGKVAGVVTFDADGSSSTTGDRTPLAGVTVQLRSGGTTLASTGSDSLGQYAFGYLESGTYDCVVLPAPPREALEATPGSGGNAQTQIDAGTIRVDLDDTQLSSGNNFVIRTDAIRPAATLDVNFDLIDCPTQNVVLSWTAVGDDSLTGTATSFDLRWATHTINAANFASATPAIGVPTPGPAGTHQTMPMVLNYGQTRCFALKTIDNVGHVSAISNCGCASMPSDPDQCIESSPVTSVDPPTRLELSRATPNPASGVVIFNYSIPVSAEGQAMEAALFDIAGRRLALVARGVATVGTHTLTVRTHDLMLERGSSVVFLRLRVGERTFTRSVVIRT
jgi:hypothetical protein